MNATPFLRRRLPALAALLCVLASATAARAQPCEGDRPPSATLGIGLLHCVGGTCMVNARDGRGWRHDFATEPRVWELAPGGPAARALREGDQITSIDGVLITTPEGGRRLANVRAGRAVRLGIRRDGREMVATVVPAAGCNTPALAVTSSPGKPDWRGQTAAPAHVASAPGPGVYFGMELECGDCGWRTENGEWRWHSTEPIRVRSVVPGDPAARGGIRAGDVLLRIDGRPLTQPGAGGWYAGLRRGQPVRFQVRRGERTVTLLVVPQLAR